MNKIKTIIIITLLFVLQNALSNQVFANSYVCGDIFTVQVGGSFLCRCDYTNNNANRILRNPDGSFKMCCGDHVNNVCRKERLDEETEEIVSCGEEYDAAKNIRCDCPGGERGFMPNGNACCGWVKDGACKSSEADSNLQDIEVTNETLNELNPLQIGGGGKEGDLTTPGGIISRALTGFIFPIAGLILFVQLLLGGFQMLTGAANSKSIDEGKGKITAAIIGFIILFSAYWIAQLLELIFGIRILS